MHVGNTVLWLIAALLCSGIAGYAFGFWEARPAIHPLAIVGAVAVVVAVIIAGAIARTRLHIRSFPISPTGQSPGARVGLAWAGVAILAGINAGALLGFIVGLRTAQVLVDILFLAGVVAAPIALTAALVLIMSRRRSGFRWVGRR